MPRSTLTCRIAPADLFERTAAGINSTQLRVIACGVRHLTDATGPRGRRDCYAAKPPALSGGYCAKGNPSRAGGDAANYDSIARPMITDIALPQTDRPYRVMASLPHGVPSRFVALHRVRFVQPGLNAAIAIAARQAGFPAVRVCGLVWRSSDLFAAGLRISGTPRPTRSERALPYRCQSRRCRQPAITVKINNAAMVEITTPAAHHAAKLATSTVDLPLPLAQRIREIVASL